MSKPNRIAKKIFRWFCKPQFQEAILGDLEEQFQEDLSQYGQRKAQRRFAWNVLRFFRPGIIKSNNRNFNHMSMLKNDLKTSIRIIKKEKLYSCINVLGLSVGFALAILILLYVKFEKSYEGYNSDADRVIRITMDYLDGETLVDQDCETYHVLGPMIQEEFPEVEGFTRAFGVDWLTVKVEQKQFKASNVYAVDHSFLKIFNYPLLHGDSETALTKPNEVVLTQSAAKKYFGKENAIGEYISLRTSDPLKIVGIVQDCPANTHLKFDLLISYPSIKKRLSERESDWNQNDTYTYLQLSSSEQYAAFQENLSQLSNRLSDQDLIANERIISQPITAIHLHSDKSYEPEQNGNASIVYFLSAVALLIILIAILNYINLSTAKAMDRAKESGIRKVVGSSLFQLRMRFFVESALLNLLAGTLALLLIIIALPAYKTLTGLPSSLEVFGDPQSAILLLSLIIGSTILSGIFPAFVLSSFRPLDVLKGKFSNSTRGVFLRKSLVVAQFTIAIFLLIQTFTASKQLDFMVNKDLGMDASKVIVINAPPITNEKESYEALTNSLLAQSSFKSVSLSSTVPGLPTASMSSTTNITLDSESRDLKNNFFIYQNDSNFFSTLEIEILAGANFSGNSNFKHPIIVNEEALKVWGVSDPEQVINQKASFWGRQNTIVGVVKNFHQLGAKSAHLPMIFLNQYKSPDFISVKLQPGETLQQIAQLTEIYAQHFPNSPFDTFFLDENFETQYRTDVRFQQILSVLSIFAILITCLGLFGLASFTIAKQAKEIGIRKVLGADSIQIIGILSKDFIRLVVLSSLIAIPLTFLIVQKWLEQYAFRIEIDMVLFVLPTCCVLIVAFATVFIKTYQATQANPVNSLRDE